MTNSERSERNTGLQQRMLAGDTTARDEMITNNIPFVHHWVNEHLRKCRQHKHLKDDLIGSATLGLVKAVDRLGKRTPTGKCNPTAYISRAIQNEITSAVRKSDIIITPRDEKRDEESITVESTDFSTIAQPDSPDTLDDDPAATLRRALAEACVDDLDRRIVKLRERGRTYATIAAALGCSDTTVGDRLKAIERRFLEKRGDAVGDSGKTA